MAEPRLYPRYAERPLAEALEDSPVVLIHGPRQSGKTTLAQMVCAPDALTWRGEPLQWRGQPLTVATSKSRGYEYLSFDDEVVRGGAEADPMGFVADLPERVILDEVQRVPALFSALKMEVDRRRVPDVSCWQVRPMSCWFRNSRTLWPVECKSSACIPSRSANWQRLIR